MSLLLSEEWVAEYEKLFATWPARVPLYVAKKPLLNTLAGFDLYQGVLAIAKIPPPPSLAEVIARAASLKLFVALDGLTNAENLGVLVRTAVAFGAQGVLAGETCPSPWLRRAVRNSMGAMFRVPVLELASLPDALRQLRASGVHCVGAHPHTDRRTLSQADFTRDCCLVFGSEGDGISEEVRSLCDELVAIPMAADVDSLNVSAACAAFFYEAARQRGKT
ncbi:MAG: RNA methyltransferase [Verrucomicrobia bacterium]|nr:RNA methyltransferase [Verrucomicrobiota bacterium]